MFVEPPLSYLARAATYNMHSTVKAIALAGSIVFISKARGGRVLDNMETLYLPIVESILLMRLPSEELG